MNCGDRRSPSQSLFLPGGTLKFSTFQDGLKASVDVCIGGYRVKFILQQALP